MNWSEMCRELRGDESVAGFMRALQRYVPELPKRTWEGWEQGKSAPPEWAKLLLVCEVNRMKLGQRKKK